MSEGTKDRGFFTRAKMLAQQALRPIARVLVPPPSKKQREAKEKGIRARIETRRKERRERRVWFRRVPRGLGYQCPRCWKWFETPEARAEHRKTEHDPKHKLEEGT